MPTRPEALRLADELEDMTCLWSPSVNRARVDKATAELRRQHGEIKSMRTERLRSERRLSAVEAQRDALLEALKELTPPMPPADAPCHVGLVPQEKCAQCGRIARARAAIKAVKEGK